jgi:hypothetical protein
MSSAPPNLPPKKKGADLKAVALFDFAGKEEDELPFKKDDIIIVLVKYDDSQWWKGTNHTFENQYCSFLF